MRFVYHLPDQTGPLHEVRPRRYDRRALGQGRMSDVRVFILGPMEVEGEDGAAVPIGGPRVRALLAMLALEPGRLVPADRLVDALWGENLPAAPANALQTLVKRLRAALLPHAAIDGRAGGYVLDLTPDDVDAATFTRLAAHGRLDEALALWRGPALADLRAVPHLANVAERLEERRLGVVEARAAARLSVGRETDLSAEVAAHPLRERLCALAMRSLAAGGRQSEALALYERTRQALAAELGVDPGAELRATHLALLRGELPAWRLPGDDEPARPRGDGVPTRIAGDGMLARFARDDVPASLLPGDDVPVAGLAVDGGTARPRPRGNVRPLPNSFVGRDQEVAGTRAALAGSRLVTIVGPGGAGKTRLATEVAARAQDDLPDGAWLVELAPVTGQDVPNAVLGALGDHLLIASVPPAGQDTTSVLLAGLAGRRLLLVLDNCEHVAEAAALLADRLLRECPDVRLLATSREPLGVPGEVLAPLPGLALPPEGAGPGEAAGYAAVRLLADRAGAVRPGFEIDRYAVEVCRRLDGLPLAIELAAARMRALTARQLAERLDDRFRLLTGGSRTALPRHRTLRAVVEWSWDLLDPGERRLARRFSVFAGGATLEAAEQVGGGEVLGLLPALVDKSLVEVDVSGRYRMLETIRAYALERLEAAGETTAYRRAHAEHFLALAERAEPRLRAAGQIGWIQRLTAEHDNFNAALRWAIGTGETELAVRLCGTLNWYWWMHYRAEGPIWAEQAVALAGPVPPPELARAYAGCLFAIGASRLGHLLTEPAGPGHLAGLADAMEGIVEAAEAEGPVNPMLRIGRAVMAGMAGGHERASELLVGYSAEDDVWLRSSARMVRGGMTADPALAERLLEEAAAGFRLIGEQWGLSDSLLQLAGVRVASGRGARELLDEVGSLTFEWVSAEETISRLTRLASLRARSGDLAGAAADLARARGGADTTRARRDVPAHALVRLRIGEAEIARRSGDLDGALAAHRDIVAGLGASGAVPRLVAWARTAYGRALADRGDVGAALDEHRAALAALGSTPDLPALAGILSGFAMAVLAGGDAGRAAVLFGAAASAAGGPGGDTDTTAAMDAARSALGAAAYDEAVARGRAMTRDQAYTLARSSRPL
ncbi:AfsR/SARP family transcriptional regulator [Sphaerisporangium corydalis]|uniref:BTAD domain-containing putative transcriptional regulator n=1 Tax=Sphaerisporangium corydalis TaxID=1441875 RepID=A0ABV9ET94_9ACTN|nr:BTAD domain-containing putative transcriptional regulator [Sphaerisporangium corydalis]